jgi:hypothetical protein
MSQMPHGENNQKTYTCVLEKFGRKTNVHVIKLPIGISNHLTLVLS